MAITQKRAAVPASAIQANPLPQELFPKLPDTVVERFPEMEQWRTEHQRIWSEVLSALDRRQQETENRIAALES